jgi:hypothetical protein
MAMKPSSKFERMKLKPSDRMSPKRMVEAPNPRRRANTMGGAMPPAEGTGGKMIPMNKRPVMDPRVAARRKAMQKMGSRYSK